MRCSQNNIRPATTNVRNECRMLRAGNDLDSSATPRGTKDCYVFLVRYYHSLNETPCACVLELSCAASLLAGARRCLRSKGKLCYIRQVVVRHSQATAPSLGLDLLTSRSSGIGGALYVLLHSLYANCPRYQRCASRIVCLRNPLVTTIRHAYLLLVVAQADVYLACTTTRIVCPLLLVLDSDAVQVA